MTYTVTHAPSTCPSASHTGDTANAGACALAGIGVGSEKDQTLAAVFTAPNLLLEAIDALSVLDLTITGADVHEGEVGLLLVAEIETLGPVFSAAEGADEGTITEFLGPVEGVVVFCAPFFAVFVAVALDE
ncbi:hypothetical protein V491_08696, partial [Pseudogymnoascus sp. VKM F-3775]